MCRLILSFGLCFVVSSVTSCSKDYYVDVLFGDDDNSGEEPYNAWRTLAWAIPQVHDGDTLYILGGTYPESVLDPTSGTSTSSLVTIKNFNSAPVTIRPPVGSLNVFKFDDKAFIKISGLILDGQNLTAGDKDVIQIKGDSHDITIDGCTVMNAPSKGIQIYENAHDVTITGGTIVEDSGSDGIKIVGNIADVTVEYSTVRNNGNVAGQGILIGGAATGTLIDTVVVFGNGNDTNQNHGIYVKSPSTTIRNCVVHDNWWVGIHFWLNTDSVFSDSVIEDNEVYNNGRANPRPSEFPCNMVVWDIGSTVSNNITIKNNVIYDSDTSDPEEGMSVQVEHAKVYNNMIYDCWKGMVVKSFTLGNSLNTQIYHNSIYNCATYGIEIEALAVATTIKNNIVYFNGSGNDDDIKNFAGSQTIKVPNWTTDDGDPGFVSGSDLHLKLSSFCIDQVDGLVDFANDIDGDYRDFLTPSAVDYGADEYVAH